MVYEIGGFVGCLSGCIVLYKIVMRTKKINPFGKKVLSLSRVDSGLSLSES